MDAFKGRVAVVTGGGGGIGAEMAEAFAGRLRAGGAEAVAIQTDVTARDAVEALAAETVRRFGAVHVVCNNAGVATFGEIATATHADWEFTMGVNFWGVVHGVAAFVPRLLAQGQGGHVVNTASMAGLVGMQ